MNSPDILFLAADLTPFTGNSARAKENHFLARALSELGLEITLAIPGHAIADPSQFGLARRISPLTIPGDPEPIDVAVHEGSLPGGRVMLVVIHLPGDHERDPAAFASAALALAEQQGSWPTVVIAGHGCEQAMAVAKNAGSADNPAPLTLFTLRRLEDTPVLRDALAHSDRIVVPSRSYAQALVDLPERDPKGQLLTPQKHALRGVASGIDPLEWNPGHDGLLARGFARDPHAGKAHHKHELQRALGLRQLPRTPLIAIVAPVDGNIMSYTAASSLRPKELQLAVLATPKATPTATTDNNAGHGPESTGLRHIERLANQAPGRFAIRSFADPEERRVFEHNLMAAADFTLFAHDFMPEPLSELYCMHYGAIPIAPMSGSFADTIVEFDRFSATGTGFLFEPHENDSLSHAVDRALRTYQQPDAFAALMQRAMTLDLSWRTTAQRYANLIVEALRSQRAA